MHTPTRENPFGLKNMEPTPPESYVLPRNNLNKISWGNIAAIASVIAILGGALIGLGRMMFASKDEYTELKARSVFESAKTEETFKRLTGSTEKLSGTVEKLNESVILLNAQVKYGSSRTRERSQ